MPGRTTTQPTADSFDPTQKRTGCPLEEASRRNHGSPERTRRGLKRPNKPGKDREKSEKNRPIPGKRGRALR